MLTDVGGSTSRLVQINTLSTSSVDGSPIIVHGSLAHAAVRGVCIPPEEKITGRVRDIDVYVPERGGKIAIEAHLGSLLPGPSPIDAGLCGLLRHNGSSVVVQKDGIIAELEDNEGILTETQSYELRGTEGIQLRSFTPTGMMAIHALEPYSRPTHQIADRRFEAWCCKEGITIPADLRISIEEFHREYRARYPYGPALKYASYIYANLLPETLRALLRGSTHRIMQKHAGRDNPFEKED
jgi:hypothetical protein